MGRITSRQRRDSRRIARNLEYPQWLARRLQEHEEGELGEMMQRLMVTERGRRALFRAELCHRKELRRDERQEARR